MAHPIPSSALDDRLAFVGNAGGGKTYSAGTAIERLLTSGARAVIPDPLGVWWGLALDNDGKTPSSFRKREQLVIFGGERGDLPLTEHAGGLIGETVAGMQESCILDLSEIGTKAAERRFMLAFLAALYKHKSGEPLHVVFDEADMWAPQRVLDKEGDAMKLLGMMETICRRGRVKGFIPWLITQRPAVVSKNVLSQVDGLIAFKLTSVQDRDAIGDWVEGQADKGQWKEMWADMARLNQGEGLVWIPARGILKTDQFPQKQTFDSSRAPKRGEKLKAAGDLQPVNLGKLKERLSKVEAESKANDPKALRAEIARLQRELSSKKPGVDAEAVNRAEAAAYAQGKIDGHAGVMAQVDSNFSTILAALDNVERCLNATKSIASELQHRSKKAPTARVAPRSIPTVQRHAVSRVKPVTPGEINGFTGPQVRILRGLAMWRALGHESPSREMVAAVAGYKPSTGNYNNLLGGLGAAGAIGKPTPGRLSLQAEGFGMAADEGRDMLLASLNSPQKRIISALVDQGTRSREEVAADAGYQPSTGNYNNLVGSLTTIDILRKPAPGKLALSEWAQELLSGSQQSLVA